MKSLSFNVPFILIWCLVFCMCGTGNSESANKKIAATHSKNSKPDPCEDFNQLYVKIRDGKITKDSAKDAIVKLVPALKIYFVENHGKNYSMDQWVFPVKGYSSNSIGGLNGNGYSVKGYDFFDGNNHTGHPAQDIFITDKNQDCLDDNTKKPVDVVSINGGIVVAAEMSWANESLLRGGKYIIVFNPQNNSLIYYAHNNLLLAKVGDIVKPGDKIAEVGRSGLNAHKKRSPTHLHLMSLKINTNGDVVPENIYSLLIKARSLE